MYYLSPYQGSFAPSLLDLVYSNNPHPLILQGTACAKMTLIKNGENLKEERGKAHSVLRLNSIRDWIRLTDPPHLKVALEN